MASAVLKISYQGELRRCLIEDITYNVVIETISKTFPEVKDYSAKYVDEEGDACTLCASSFPDFLAVSRAGNSSADVPSNKLILRLELISTLAAASESAKSFEEQACEHLGNLGAGAIPMLAPMLAGMKGLFKGKGEGKCRRAAGDGSADGSMDMSTCPMALMMAPMMGMFAGMKGLFKGKGKGKGKYPWVAGDAGASSFITPKKLASFLTAMLPKVLPHVVSQDLQFLGHALQGAISGDAELRTVLESMKQLLEKTEGLQHCAGSLEAALGGDVDSVGQFLLALLTGLDVLSFERQIAFFEDFCNSCWGKIQQLIAMMEQFMPWIGQMLVHPHVICDGCGANPIKGPRFKCKSLPNFDLCGECFAQKNSVNDGQCAEHDFDCIMMPGRGMCGKGMCGKGMWEGKGMWKGKGHCKGKRKASETQKMETETCTGETMSFPVEVADGRKLQIQWQRGEDPATAAARFAQEHAIQYDELAAIIDFIRHAEQITPSAESKQADQEPAKDANENEAMTEAPSTEPEKVACKRQRLEEGEGRGPLRFAFPVMLEDGRELRMEWTSGQDLEDLSRSFAKQHDLPEESVPQLLDAARRMDATPAALQQLKAMGFGVDEEALRELLEVCGNDAQKVVEMLMQSQA